MKNISIAIEHDCDACEGKGYRPNPDYNPHDPFPESHTDPCWVCGGRKRISKYIPLAEFLNTISELDIPTV